MERYTALLEVTPYSWLTLVTVALGAVGALASLRAERRRYPAIFRRRRAILVLLFLLLAALAVPLSIFVPGADRFPSLGELLLFVLPLTLLWGILFRFAWIGIPLAAIAVSLLIWAESVATAEFVFPGEGRGIVFLDVREVQEDRIDLFVELPMVSARRLLKEPRESSFPLSLNGEELAVLGTELRLHPYLWWRYPSTGVRVAGFAGAPPEHPPFAPVSERSENFISFLETLGAVRLTEWRVAMPSEDLLLARYELALLGGGIVISRGSAQEE